MTAQMTYLLLTLILLSACATSPQPPPATETPIPEPTNTIQVIEEIDLSSEYIAFEEALTEGDIDEVMGYFHEDAVLCEESELNFCVDIKSQAGIRVKISGWINMQDSMTKTVHEIEQEGDTVRFVLDYMIPGSGHFQRSGYAQYSDGKIIDLHFYPLNELPEAAEEWDYVVLGSSVTRGYPWLLKEKIEEDFDGKLTIEIHDWYQGGQSSSQLLGALQNNESLRESIRGAELITFLIPWGGCNTPMRTYDNGGPCGGTDNQDCLRECLATYKADTDAIFAELINLRSPSEAVIRAHDMYQLMTSRLQDHGKFEVVNSYWREGNSHVHSVAESYGIPVANVYDAFMGEDGAQPPEDNGLVISDMVHPTEEGQQLIADLLYELGYGLVEP